MRVSFKIAIVVIVVVAAVALLGLGYIQYRSLEERVLIAEETASTTQQELVGYSKYTDYIAKGKQTLQGDTKLITAKLNQESKWIEHVDKKVLFFKTSGTVIMNLAAEYNFGFDLSPGKYDVVPTKTGLEIRVGKPIPVARTSVQLVSWDIASRSLLIDEQKAALDLITRIQPAFDEQAKVLAQSEPVRALCEKKLIEHLSSFLGKQPGVKFVPQITVAYR